MGMGTGMETMCSAPLHSQVFAALVHLLWTSAGTICQFIDNCIDYNLLCDYRV